MLTRPVTGEQDTRLMLALAYATATDQSHLLDLPYRLCSPAFYDNAAEDTRLWFDDNGDLLAFAVWQRPFVTLDYALRPDAPGTLGDELLAWATARFAAIAQEIDVRYPYWCEARPDQADRRALLARHGFAPAPTWQLLHLTQPLDRETPPPSPPPGFTIRPLAGHAETAAYVATQQAAFNSQTMTVPWRQRTLVAPGYRPDLDLVIEAPDGRLAACCLVWSTPTDYLSEHSLDGHIEPLSVHPDFHRLGLGRAILLAALLRLRALGATGAAVDVYNNNPAARHLYESVGFRVAYAREKWRREF